MYVLEEAFHESVLRDLEPVARSIYCERIEYLRNMSCMGQAHPDFERCRALIQQRCGVTVRLTTVDVEVLTYGALSSLFNFRGTDVLMIDAEGCDCQILQSMVDHCKTEDNEHAWPDVIQFETLGHSNYMSVDVGAIDACAESAMITLLEENGYVVVARSQNTQLVRAAILWIQRIQNFLTQIECGYCQTTGCHGMPYVWSQSYTGLMCRNCGVLENLRLAAGLCAWKWSRGDGNRHP